jgi:hypothetical protein
MLRTRLGQMLAAASLLAGFAGIPATASASELVLLWDRSFDVADDSFDLAITGGGSSTSALSLTSGTDVGSSTYHVNLGTYAPTATVLYADFAGLVGGTVSYGHISGGISAFEASNVPGIRNETRSGFRASFIDSVTIVSANPALLGTPGTMSGSVLVDVSPSVTTIGPDGIPGPQAFAEVSWRLEEGGSNVVGAYYNDNDDTGPDSGFCCIGPLGTSPAPTSVLIPILVSFQFGVPFDFGLAFVAEAGANAGGSVVDEGKADAAMNFLNTVAWQGIASVTSNGVPVDFTLSSGSGTDYTQAATAAVPAPAGIWLLGTALAGLAARRWRRRN